ncbi:MAG: glutamine-hydrolyzing GMP synthase [Pyrinomonadaceae bacterium]
MEVDFLISNTAHETIVVLDFGSQYTQLIARRIREAGVYCEILPFNATGEQIYARQPKGLILSGGPASVYAAEAPRPITGLLEEVACPTLGICYGFQLMAIILGGKVQASERHEYGLAQLNVIEPSSPLFADLPSRMDVWMSHGDQVTAMPSGFRLTAVTNESLNGFEDLSKRLFGLQFHPEVAHSPFGGQILKNFLFNICKCRGDWSPLSVIETQIESIRQKAGASGRIICGLSGGVDSTVAAALVNEAVGERQHCIFIDNGVLRDGEYKSTLRLFKETMKLNLHGVKADERFLDALRGVVDPELKRKIIGREFIEVFDEEAARLGNVKYLVQGTLYPDVIESVSVNGPSAVIKSHHNVGGLPEQMKLQLLEPLRELFKDEVRLIGRELGVPEEVLQRHPFPGPGMAVRILGEVTAERVRLLQVADRILSEELRRANVYHSVWQAFPVLLPVSTVGVMGDARTYEQVLAIRAVTSLDGMTADWARLPHDLLAQISSRLISEVRGINRVVYDISSKPPSTIEWE